MAISETKQWSFLRKVIFRFLFIFFILSIAPWELIPFTEDFMSKIHYAPAIWVQNNILHNRIAIQHPDTGSGDTTDDWVLFGIMLLLSVIGCIVWSAADRKCTDYEKLKYRLRVLVRYYLAYMMFSYGFFKVFKAQFPFPTLTQLYTPLGDFTPMRLAWLFFGYSTPYTAFGGYAEVLGGLLLLFRKTITLGALVLLAVVGNVVMLNFSYDIPVKLFSCILLLMVLFLLAPDFSRLFSFFILNKPTVPSNSGLRFEARWQKWPRIALMAVFWGYGFFYTAYQGYSQAATVRHKSEWHGAYDVLNYSLNGSADVASSADTVRWSQVVIGEGWAPNEFSGAVRRGNLKAERVTFKTDSTKSRWTIAFRGDTSKTISATFAKLDSNRVLLNGKLRNDSLRVVLKRNDREFTLLKHPFHWVAEFPW